MTRRSRRRDKQTKARRRKAETPKRGAARTLRRRNSSAVVQETDVTRLRRERDPSVSRLIIINHVLTPTIVEMNSLRTADTGPA